MFIDKGLAFSYSIKRGIECFRKMDLAYIHVFLASSKTGEFHLMVYIVYTNKSITSETWIF